MRSVILLALVMMVVIISASYAVVPYGMQAPDFTGVYEYSMEPSVTKVLEIRPNKTAVEITCYGGSKRFIKTGTWDTTLVELVITWDGTPPGYLADVYVLLFRGIDLVAVDWTNKPYNAPEMVFRPILTH